MDPAVLPDGTTYVLTDGPTESLAVLAAMANAGQHTGKVVAVENPYPFLCFYLGSYYNEIGKPGDALRALDAGLALSAKTGQSLSLGAQMQFLVGERGIALVGLKRWPEALAAYEDGLKLANLETASRARLLRGRGLALTELGRLDDAEQSYRDSLKIDPGSALAQGELDYIARLKAGAAPSPTAIIPLQPQPGSPDKAANPPAALPPATSL